MEIIFAPQVRTIQPAFVKEEEEAKIYFSLSGGNTIDDITSVIVKITNPKTGKLIPPQTIERTNVRQDLTTKEYYISIDTSELMQTDQYYQAQLFLNSEKSDGSQVTLLRPIQSIAESNVFVDIDNREISGKIEYAKKSVVEVIKSYNIVVEEVKLNNKGETDEETVVYSSKEIDNKNNGLTFSTIIDYYFKEGANYRTKVNYTTLHGYENTITSDIVPVSAKTENTWTTCVFTLSDNENGGAVHIEIQEEGTKIKENGVESITPPAKGGTISIERSEEASFFSAWERLTSFELKDAFYNYYTLSWDDYTITGGKIYKYRIVLNRSNEEKISEYKAFAPNFGDIFLSDVNKQLAIRYNSNISSFKWVTQESITNTLGGKYPLIRRNAETKYRQFNLSGLVYIDPAEFNLSSVKAVDSQGHPLNPFQDDNEASLFISEEDMTTFRQHIKNVKDLNGSVRSDIIYEKNFRDLAMSFLTNGSVKLFRSYQEGNIIVYLSNISFTPNKELDRRVYDFSATVTELCEATEQNLKKYKIYKPAEVYRYVLKVTGDNNKNGIEFSPYVSIDKLFNENTLILEYDTIDSIIEEV